MNNTNKIKDQKRIENFRLMDDDFMGVVFNNNIEATQLVIDIILKNKNIKVKKVITQKEYRSLQGRTIKLDVFAEDNNGIPIDIEIQRADKGAVPQRARFHSSMMDSEMLKKQDDFSTLKEPYVIFITENDVLKKGLPIYHINRKIEETGESFGDGSHIIYVNGKYVGTDDIGMLMHDFRCTKAEEMNFVALSDKVRYFKEDEGGRDTMCKIIEDMRNEATIEAYKVVAINLLKAGKMTVQEIAEASRLTIEDVESLKKNLDAES